MAPVWSYTCRLPHHIGAQRKVLNVGTDTGWITEDSSPDDQLKPQTRPQLAAAAAAAAAVTVENVADRWAPDDSDGSDHRPELPDERHDGGREHVITLENNNIARSNRSQSPGPAGRGLLGLPGFDQLREYAALTGDETHADYPAAAAARGGEGVGSGGRGHTSRSRSPMQITARQPSTAAAAGRKQQQQRVSSPVRLPGVLAGRQALSGLRNDERDELRSLALLHLVGHSVAPPMTDWLLHQYSSDCHLSNAGRTCCRCLWAPLFLRSLVLR